MNTEQNPLHRPLAAGDWVIVGQGEEYAGLVGQVKEIILPGSPEHDTGNYTDDIVVDLSLVDYSDNEKTEILANAKKLGYEADSYDDVSIDSVILAPDDLIRITPQELEQHCGELTASLQSAEDIGEMLSARHYNELHAALVDRVEQNYTDYQASLENFGAGELIDMASAIHAYSDADSYMTIYHDYDESELSFYLQFDNPLEIVADRWKEQKSDLDDMSFTMDFLNEPPCRKTALEFYPLYTEKPKPDVKITMKRESALMPGERLEHKARAEYAAFLRALEKKPPCRIIESSYEKVFKEDLLLTVESGGFSEEQTAALMSLDNPLEALYQDWLDSDKSYMDMLSDCARETADALVKERREEQTKAKPVARGNPKTQPAPNKAKTEPPQKKSILSELDAAVEEARKLNAARSPQAPQKYKNKEID